MVYFVKSNPTDLSQDGVDDKERFTHFVLEVGPEALRIAHRWTQNSQTSEDLVQEAFLRTWRSRTVVTENLRGWFFKVLWNVFLDSRRYAKNHHGTDLQSNTLFSEEIGSYKIIEDRMDVDMLLNALADDDRYLIALRYGEDLPFEDIAMMTGIPAGTIRVKIHRALKQIKRLLPTKPRAERAQTKISNEVGR